MKSNKDAEAYEGSGSAALAIGGLAMFAGLGLFVCAFQSAVSDGPYTAPAWLIGFALAVVGVFVWSNGMRKQRLAGEIAQRGRSIQVFEVISGEECMRQLAADSADTNNRNSAKE